MKVKVQKTKNDYKAGYKEASDKLKVLLASSLGGLTEEQKFRRDVDIEKEKIKMEWFKILMAMK